MRASALVLPLALSALLAPRAALAQPTEANLLAADAEQKRIIVEEDLAAQRAFMHDNYLVNAPANRVMTKAQALGNMAAGGVASERFERVVEATRITGEIGVVMGREEIVPAPGSELARRHGAARLHRRFTNVFLWEEGRWRFLARQASIVAP